MSTASRIFTDEQRKEVEAAIADAETRTAGELVVCIADRSGRYDRGEDLFGVVTGLAAVGAAWLLFQRVAEADWGPAPVLGLAPVLLLFLGGFILGAVLATRVPVLGLFFTGRKEMAEEVHRQARVAFHQYGVHGTREATGILIFVSLLERIAWVVGDDAINAKIPQDRWDEMRDRVVAGFKSGHPARGLKDAIAEAGRLLAEHLPGSHDDVDELDNSIRFLGR